MREHFPALDGVRGIAILAVLLLHFVGMTLAPVGPISASIHTLASLGWAGVDLFFVLSGFLITGILIESRDSPTYFRAFYARRTMRIFPLYFAVVGLYVLLAPRLLVSDATSLMAFHKLEPSLWSYTSNFAFAHASIRDSAPIQVQMTWSLAVEEQFYVVWPLVVFLVPTHRLKAACLMAAFAAPIVRVVVSIAMGPGYTEHMLMPARLDSLALGGYIAARYRLDGTASVLRWARRVQWPAGGVLLILMLMPPSAVTSACFRSFGLTALAVFFAAAVADAVCLPKSFWARVGTVRWLQRVGGYAYGLYLLHGLVWMVLSANQIDAASIGRALDVPPLVAVAIYALGAMSLSILCAVISWHSFEGPINRLKRFARYQPNRATIHVPGSALS